MTVRLRTLAESIWKDVRFGLRTLGRSPGYACAAVLILALGIGANTAMFSVIDGVLLKPLPFRSGDELVLVRQSAPGSNVADASVSIPELVAYRTQLTAVRDLVEYHSMSFVLLNQGEPDRVDTGVVSSNFFEVLGVRPQLGRTFNDTDDDLGAEPVLVLSHRYWQEKFGGDSDVVGRVVEMNDHAHTVVGVLPAFPQYPRDNDVYMPTSACPFRSGAERRMQQNHRTFAALNVFGRLAPQASVDQASTEIRTVAGGFTRDFPQDYQRAREFTGQAESLRDQLVRDARPMLLALSGATMLVLIIACANVANLALARAVRRGRELALRLALGAGRARLVRQLVTESMLVAVAGGVGGVLLAWWSVGLLVDFVGRFTPRTGQIDMDASVFAFAVATSLVTGVVFGALPAFAVRRNIAQSMRDGAAQSGDGGGRQRLRSTLVVAQVGVSFVLLVGAGLLLQSFYRLSAVPLGFDTNRVMTAAIFGNFSRTPQDTLRIETAILDGLRASPGVTSAALTTAVPLSDITPGQQAIVIEGRPADDARPWQVDPNVASDGYFETLGVPVLAGRSFRESDRTDPTPVAVINQTMAGLWDREDPVGRRFRVAAGGSASWITVVGVVGDFKLYGADSAPTAEYYAPVGPANPFAGRLLVRTDGNPYDLIPVIKAAVARVDPTAPVEELQTIEELENGRLAVPGVTAALLSMFAFVALVITVAGIAGLVATSVSQRTREFGLRMALGASRGSVLGQVLRQGLLLVSIGLVIGVGGAWAFGRLIARYLFSTRPDEPLAYLAVAAIFVVAALVAAAGPARRAVSIDPLAALRSD